MKLRLGIQRVGSIVFGRVLEQDESLRDDGMGQAVTCLDNAVVKYLRSWKRPSLAAGHTECSTSSCALYIRGRDIDGDNDWFARKYTNCETAIQAVEDIKMLVAKVNAVERQDDPDDCGLEIIE